MDAQQAAPGPRPFTIKDAIELAYIINPVSWSVNQEPPAAPIIAPDRKHLLLITQRGLLASNELESTIWVFDRQAVADFLAKRTRVRPSPQVVATFRAVSNLPVVTDVRWLADSRRISFLAKTESSGPQLYVADIQAPQLKRLTSGDDHVTAYDMQGETVAYTTLNETHTVRDTQDLVAVTGKSIWTLLWRDRSIGERDEDLLLDIANTLHVIRGGHDLARRYTMEGSPLRLFFPVLSLSPDGQSLITVAPVRIVPPAWAVYRPWFGYEDLALRPDNKWALAEENTWKASAPVRVDLATGIASPLVDAPAGRSLFFIQAPTKIIWSPDARRVLLSNTFLPARNDGGTVDTLTFAAPAVAIVDLATHEVQPITYLEQPPRNTRLTRRVSDVTWDPRANEVVLTYASSPDNVPVAFQQSFRLRSGHWAREGDTSQALPRDRDLSVYQDLNRAPVLSAARDPQRSVVWDPNPQLRSIALGQASLYRWQDKDGNAHAGTLVLPPGYNKRQRYPLVIQTHGYEPAKFFADGRYTTGSGGRALAAHGIVVLQVDQSIRYIDTPNEGPFQTESFRSAIHQLAAEGVIDPRRVGVIGFSFTVFHVLYALTHEPELFAAATITDGNDLGYWLYLTWVDLPWAQKYAETMNGGVMPFGKEGLLKWAESAPGFNLDRVRTPLLISCLEKGTLVATWDIYGGLRTLKKPVDLLWLRREDAPHVLVQPRHRYLSQQAAVDWFDFWLNAHEDTEPSKTEQYARWRQLREAGQQR